MYTMIIELPNDKPCFLPGDEVSGVLRWDFKERPDRIDLRLFFRARPRRIPELAGYLQEGIADSVRIARPALAGSQTFRFVIPEGPYSFTGRFVSVRWELEATATPHGEKVLKHIVVSPTGKPIGLANSADSDLD